MVEILIDFANLMALGFEPRWSHNIDVKSDASYACYTLTKDVMILCEMNWGQGVTCDILGGVSQNLERLFFQYNREECGELDAPPLWEDLFVQMCSFRIRAVVGTRLGGATMLGDEIMCSQSDSIIHKARDKHFLELKKFIKS